MIKVELKEGMSVETSDGRELGKINRFVLDPETNEVTHIVVQKGTLLPEDKVVPFDRVSSAKEEKLVLNQDTRDFDHLPPFEENYYVRADDRDVSSGGMRHDFAHAGRPAYYWYPPYGYLGYPAYGLAPYGWPRSETVQNIPSDTVPLKEGTNVMSADDRHVGDVERLFVETGSNKATHFLISQGLFFKDQKLVPANWIRSVTDKEVRLNVASELLESLPTYKSE